MPLPAAAAPAPATVPGPLSGRAKSRAAKLSAADVDAIRHYAANHRHVSQREMAIELGADYGVSPFTIREILNGATWRDEPAQPPPANETSAHDREMEIRRQLIAAKAHLCEAQTILHRQHDRHLSDADGCGDWCRCEHPSCQRAQAALAC